jgi:uncharacterized protein (TIGR02265 family)
MYVTERIVFGSSVEGQLRALGPELSPEVKRQLIALGVNPDKLLPGYSVPVYAKLIDFVGAQRFPELEGAERDRALGREFIIGFGHTFVGKATLAMGKVLGPMRATLRLTRTMRTVNNYSVSEAIPLSSTSVQVWCQPVLRPWYYVGVFEQAGKQLHGDSYKVELQKFEGERADFLVSW